MPAVISDNSLERSPTIDSLSATQRLNLHGANYANMIKSANDDIVALSSSRVNAVYAAYDSEVDWNTYDNTYAWISGYGSVSGRRNIYVNADCPIAANGAETLTNKGWNYLRLRYIIAVILVHEVNMVYVRYRLSVASGLFFKYERLNHY